MITVSFVVRLWFNFRNGNTVSSLLLKKCPLFVVSELFILVFICTVGV